VIFFRRRLDCVIKAAHSHFSLSYHCTEMHIDQIIEKSIEQVGEKCYLWNRNIFDDTIVRNRPIVPKMSTRPKSHYVDKTITPDPNLSRCDEETCNLHNRNVSDHANPRNRLAAPMMSKLYCGNNVVPFPTSCRTSNVTCKEMQYDVNPVMPTTTLFGENELRPSSNKSPMMKMNSSQQAKFPSNCASENASLARRYPLCNSSIEELGLLNFTDGADPNHRKRSNWQIDQVGSYDENDFPNKARIVMKMRLIERHGLKTRIVMEPCLVHE
jgi:hypothetical protein